MSAEAAEYVAALAAAAEAGDEERLASLARRVCADPQLAAAVLAGLATAIGQALGVSGLATRMAAAAGLN